MALQQINIVSEAQTIIRPKPANFNSNDEFLFKSQFTKSLQATALFSFKNVYVLGDTVFDPTSFKFYSEHTHIHPLNLIHRINRIKWLLRPINTIEKGLWAIDEWSSGYFHWLAETMPRIVAANELYADFVLILPDDYSFNYIAASLNLLEIPFVLYKKRECVKVNQLQLVTHAAPTGHYAPNLMCKTSNRFIKAVESKTSLEKFAYSKLYVSREKAKYRKILNEKDLYPILEKYGYKVIYFEDYNLAEQINIMKTCSHFIGLHGANLTNMMFMPAKGKVFELRNHNDSHNNCYYALACALELDYFYSLNKASSAITGFADFVADTSSFEEVIKLMG